MGSDKGMLFFYDWKPVFEELPPEDCKALLIAMLNYKQNQTPPPDFSGAAKIAALFVFPAIERADKLEAAGRKGGLKSQEASKGASKGASEGALKGCSSTKQDKTKQDKTKQDKTKQDKTKTDIMAPSVPSALSLPEEEKQSGNTKEPQKCTRFIPPTLEEVQEYCRERKSTVDAEAFHDFYTANGWTQGKGKPIKDWKAAVRTWEKRDRAEGKTALPENVPGYTPPYNPLDEITFDD